MISKVSTASASACDIMMSRMSRVSSTQHMIADSQDVGLEVNKMHKKKSLMDTFKWREDDIKNDIRN